MYRCPSHRFGFVTLCLSKKVVSIYLDNFGKVSQGQRSLVGGDLTADLAAAAARRRGFVCFRVGVVRKAIRSLDILINVIRRHGKAEEQLL